MIQQERPHQVVTINDHHHLNQQLLHRMQKISSITGFTQINGRFGNMLADQGSAVSQWTPVKLSICTATNPNLLNSIKNINFIQLKGLYLKDDKITSIEGLSRLNAPQLKSINIQKNNVVDIRPLNKVKSTQISTLQLVGNQILEITQMYQGCYQNLQSIQFDITPEAKYQCDSLSVVAKLSCSSSTRKIYMLCQSRIKQKTFIELMKNHKRQNLQFTDQNHRRDYRFGY